MKHKSKILALVMIFSLIFSSFLQALAAPKSKRSTAPAAPSSISASQITETEITLNWSRVRKVSGYKLYIAENIDSNYSLIATTTSTSFKVTGLKPNTDYWFFVKSYKSSSDSADSKHIKATTLAPALPPEEPVPPVDTESAKLVLGFTTYYYSGDKSSYNSLVNNSQLIDEMAAAAYSIDGQGNISGLVPTEQITYSNDNGITSLALVANNFDGSIAKTLLESAENRKNFINNLIIELEKYNFKGVNIDFEGVYYYDRNFYTTFLSELYNTLNPLGYIVSVSVPAKTSDSPTNSWSGAYDYAQIANFADQIIIMTYDEHYPGGSPGPVASINWFQKVAEYAASVIPKDKIILGTAAYGYDWSQNGTKAYSINGMYNLAASYNAEIKWDSTSQCPYFNYTDSTGIYHTVWFENSTSLSYKLDVVNNMDLKGIGIWRLGIEDADYWTTIKTKFNK
ncbi:glycosyl hydrolase family 18 protein [Clostridium ganghwense]|uniref:Glycosyl hydrolase family 18 protein n=1 Tax=Clostridium ganghwense TaxID=312089 RepID=A0ABT4CPR7_9CLOT|nr:glycosyl hydrolase family 18 protein [Clostridium ganghwense]MCY6371044.1 glycosyl hydrolase family 18 protein [Clostridium ganghwense]